MESAFLHAKDDYKKEKISLGCFRLSCRELIKLNLEIWAKMSGDGTMLDIKGTAFKKEGKARVRSYGIQN